MSGDRRAPALAERPVLRDEFRRELRARLMSEAALVLAPRPRAPLFIWLRPAFAAAVVAVLAYAGAASAAASSLPGDSLYGLKRANEDVLLAVTFDDVARMQLLSDLADRRLAELAEVARRRPAAAPTATSQYADAVDRFADAVDRLREADSDDRRDAAQNLAEAAREKRKAVLDAVKETFPAETRTEVDRVIEKEENRSKRRDDPGVGGAGGATGGTGGRPTGQPMPKK